MVYLLRNHNIRLYMKQTYQIVEGKWTLYKCSFLERTARGWMHSHNRFTWFVYGRHSYCLRCFLRWTPMATAITVPIMSRTPLAIPAAIKAPFQFPGVPTLEGDPPGFTLSPGMLEAIGQILMSSLNRYIFIWIFFFPKFNFSFFIKGRPFFFGYQMNISFLIFFFHCTHDISTSFEYNIFVSNWVSTFSKFRKWWSHSTPINRQEFIVSSVCGNTTCLLEKKSWETSIFILPWDLHPISRMPS